jgi:CRP-like cAMP-binding protein
MLKIQHKEAAMKENLPILQRCALFSGIHPEDLPVLLTCLGGKVHSYKKDQIIWSEGDRVAHIGIVLTGAVQLIREDYDGNRSIMGHMGPGQLFGETYAYAGVKALPVSVVADADSTVLLVDSHRICSSCSNACDFHKQLIENMLHLTAQKNLMLHQKIHITSKRTTREKLMAYLHAQAKEHGAASFTIPFDRQALADYLEVDRSGLSAEISKLRREGILESEKSSFTLLV